MSTLKVETIQDTNGNNSSTPQQVASGRAKAWVEFSGQGSATDIVSFGVSSIQDNGVDRRSNGNYTVNFSSNFSNTNYAVFATSGLNVDSLTNTTPVNERDNVAVVLNKFVDKVYIGCGDLDDGEPDDQDRISVIIFA